jgi:hypothetical protein
MRYAIRLIYHPFHHSFGNAKLFVDAETDDLDAARRLIRQGHAEEIAERPLPKEEGAEAATASKR